MLRFGLARRQRDVTDRSARNLRKDGAEGPGDRTPDESNDLTRPVLHHFNQRERSSGRSRCITAATCNGLRRDWSLAVAPRYSVRLSIQLCRLTC